MPTVFQDNFTGGELSPSLHNRTTLAKYATGLSKCFNFIVKAHGGAANRPGTQFIGEVNDSTKAGRLIPFSFNTEQTYMLLFENQSIRIIKDGGFVLEAAKTISGATQANPVVVTATGHSYENGDEIYVTGVVGMTELNGRNYLVKNKTTNTFELTDLGGTNINSTGFTAYGSAGTAERIYTVTSPYLEANLPLLKYAQSNDVMTLTENNYSVRDLTRTGHSAWTLTETAFTPTQTWPTGITATQGGSTGSENYKYKVTAFNEEDGEESLPGADNTTAAISGATAANPVVVTATGHPFTDGEQVIITGVVGMTEINNRRFTVQSKTTNTFELADENGSAYTAYSSGGSAATSFVEVTNGNATLSSTDKITIAWTAAANADSYNVYKYDNGVYGFIGTTEEATFVDDGIEPTLTDTPPKERNPFITSYPAVSTYFEQRKMYANRSDKPQTMYMSQSANYNNMTHSSPRKDDDAITRTIAARQVNEIRWLVPLQDLIVMTSGSIWRMITGQENAITPTSINIVPQDNHGAANVPPLEVDASVVYVQSEGNKVRDLAYKLESDKYSGTDLTVLSEHFFENNTIVDWCYAEVPFSVIWCVRDDGKLLGLTYLREHEVWAWHEHEIANGTVENIASITEGTETAVYMIVKRTINSRSVRYVERLHTRYFTDVQDAFFVDCGLTVDNPITITNATKANPVVVTTSGAHGFSNGDVVDISDMLETYTSLGVRAGGMTEINGTGFKVAGVTSTTFQLQNSDAVNIDGSAYNTYVSGQGKVRKAGTSITGLHHLEGETVSALGNGNVFEGLTVTSGAVTLPNAASRVHVGYGYLCDLATLRPEIKNQSTTTIMNKKRKISQVDVLVLDTRGLWVGPDAANLVEGKQGLLTLTDGSLAQSIRPKWDKEGKIYIRQPSPLPATVTGIVSEVDVES